MLRAFCILACPMFCKSTFADDLDVIVDRNTTPEECGKAYYRLVDADFRTIAMKLAKLKQGNNIQFGFLPRLSNPNQPWNGPGPSEWRICLTLDQLWTYHLDVLSRKPHYTALLVWLLDTPGFADMARFSAISGIEDRLRAWKEPADPSELSKAELVKELDSFARNAKNALDLREKAISVLCEYSDPNACVDLLLETIGSENPPLKRDILFRECLPREAFVSLTPANQRKCIRVGFEWLKEMSKDNPEMGSLHAGHLEGMVNIANGNGAVRLFEPDMVKNALAWWDKHHAEYEDAEPKSP